jgi:hypothetical protein
MIIPMRFLIVFAMLLPLAAQPPQGGEKKGPPPPKNLKVLKADEYLPAMRSFTVALGVNCNYCHVQGDRASDANPKKDIARMMIAMARDVNSKFPDGADKMHVTCYTCHRGKTEPETTPPAAPGQ